MTISRFPSIEFTLYDLIKKSEGKIRELEVAIAERSRVYDGYVANQKEATEFYSRQVQRAVKYAISDSEADALVKEAKEEYDKKLAEYSGSMERLRNELADPSWVLVVVNFLDGSERWGTIKSDRYKKSELKNDDLFAEKKYGCWLVNKDSHRFVFDRETRIFSEIRSGRVLGKYTFEEFDQLTQERGMVGEFSPYEFNIDKQ